MADHLGGRRELGEPFGLGQDVVGGREHRAVLLVLVQRVKALHHAADLGDGVVVALKSVAPQDVEQHEGVAGGERVDRQRAVLEIGDRFHVGGGDQAQKTGVAAHEGLRLRPDRSFALAFRLGDDVVDGGHGDVEFAFGKTGHLRDRAGGRLHGYPNAVLLEQPVLLGDVDSPVEAAGEHVDADFARTLRERRPRQRQEAWGHQGRATERIFIAVELPDDKTAGP